MATKKSIKKKKSNVSSNAKKQKFVFKWWMAAIGVLVVALIGVIYIQQSQAATVRAMIGNNGYQVVGIGSGHIDVEWLPNPALKARLTQIGKYNSGVVKYIARSSQNIGIKDQCVYIGPQQHTLESALNFKKRDLPPSQVFKYGLRINVFQTTSCYE